MPRRCSWNKGVREMENELQEKIEELSKRMDEIGGFL